MSCIHIHAYASTSICSHVCIYKCVCMYIYIYIWADLDLMWGHLGTKLGPRWVFLGAFWAMLGHLGTLLEGPGRHTPIWSLHVSRRPHANGINKTLNNCFSLILEAGSFKGVCQARSLEVWLWSWKPSCKSWAPSCGQQGCQEPTSSLFEPILGPSWPYVEASWATCGVEVGFVR